MKVCKINVVVKRQNVKRTGTKAKAKVQRSVQKIKGQGRIRRFCPKVEGRICPKLISLYFSCRDTNNEKARCYALLVHNRLYIIH